MNTMIIFSSKYGCTAECAEYLKTALSNSVKLMDINNTDIKISDLENYDSILLGSSIYVGAISKKMEIFCEENADLLSKKRVGIFLCCAFQEQLDEYLSKNFPQVLLKNAVVIKSFGGEARLDKMKTIDKLIMKTVTKGNYSNLKISYEEMDSFIKEIMR